MIKIYLAGPDVFRENAVEHLNSLKELCSKYEFEGLAPLDNIIIVPEAEQGTPIHSNLIFKANLEMIKQCDVIIANIEPFRGACIDDGTAWEIGCGFALGKKIWGYSGRYADMSLKDITEGYQWNSTIDTSEYTIVEDFGNSVNLMIADSIRDSGGEILNTFEACLESVNKFHNIDELKTLSLDKDFIDLLITKKLKTVVVKSQAYEKAAELRDVEKRLYGILEKRYDNLFVLNKLNINLCKGVKSHSMFDTTKALGRYATKLLELNLETAELSNYYIEEKNLVIAELKQRLEAINSTK